MAHNKLYRNFIILQEDEKLKAKIEEKNLSGYAKIEAKGDKCKISFYAQNLIEKKKYSIVLICNKKNCKQIIELGSIIGNKSGKGEVCKEYSINDIAGLNFSYDVISGAGISTNDKTSLVLYGFMNGEKIDSNWNAYKLLKYAIDGNTIDKEIKKEKTYIKKNDNKNENDKCEAHHNKDKEDDCKDHKHKADEHKDSDEKYEKHKKDNCKDDDDKHKEDDDKHDDHEEDDDKHDDKHDDHEKDEYEDNNDKCKKRETDKIIDKSEEKQAIDNEKIDFEDYETRINNESEIDPYEFSLRGTLGKFFEDIVQEFEQYKIKSKEIKYCKWYKVKINSIDDMCNVANYNKYTIAYFPMINNYPYIKKYGHFIIGYKCDKKGNLRHIVYGVPGRKSIDEQPYGGKTGFVTWMETENQGIGYWIMFYDYKTSTIVVPME